jgi:hypothetical protein
MRLFVPLSSLLVMATGAAVGVLVAMNGSVASWAQTSLAINAWTSPALTPRQMRPPLNRTGLVIKPMGESASPEFVRLRDDEVRVSAVEVVTDHDRRPLIPAHRRRRCRTAAISTAAVAAIHLYICARRTAIVARR